MKYETGANEISAIRMRELGVALEVPASFFSEGFANAFNSAVRLARLR
jgi:hypothetical protein